MNNLTLINKIKIFITNHKIWSLIILAIIIIISYFLFFKTKVSTETKYITSKVEKGSIFVTVSGSGQIAATDTIELKAKTSGEITYVGVKVGDNVNRGKLIASVDSRDASLALENAKIALEKLVGAPDSLTLIQKQNSLDKLYSDGWNNSASFITDMNVVVSGISDLHSIGYLGYQNKMLLSSSGKEKVDLSEKAYWDSKNSLEKTTAFYKTLSISSSKEDIEKLLNQILDTSKIISNAVKLSQTSFDYTVNSLDEINSSKVTDAQKNLTSWTASTNSYLNSSTSSLNSIKENSQSLKDFLAGADALDVKSAKLSVDNKQAAYNDCFIYAPFDGIIASLTAQVGETASSSLGTLITKQKIATISLNEVDIAKIKLNQKVTLIFDAIENLTITGKVAEIDSIGTVSQGVVTYNIKISLDVEDSRIKPGMSVAATIITDMKQDVLIVPNSAIKNQNGVNYVEMFNTSSLPVSGPQGLPSINLPNQVEVQTGLVDDTSTEITLGLKEGDIIVIKTIAATAAKATTAPSILGSMGGNRTGGGGGGAMRDIQAH